MPPGRTPAIRLPSACEPFPGPAIESQLSRVSGRLDPSTRTMTAEIELKNQDRQIKLLPGMFGEVSITLAERNALVLPAGVVRYDGKGNSYVYAVGSDSTVSRVDVGTGLDDGREIEITSGLTGNEQIITATIGRFKPGQKVRVE